MFGHNKPSYLVFKRIKCTKYNIFSGVCRHPLGLWVVSNGAFPIKGSFRPFTQLPNYMKTDSKFEQSINIIYQICTFALGFHLYKLVVQFFNMQPSIDGILPFVISICTIIVLLMGYCTTPQSNPAQFKAHAIGYILLSLISIIYTVHFIKYAEQGHLRKITFNPKSTEDEAGTVPLYAIPSQPNLIVDNESETNDNSSLIGTNLNSTELQTYTLLGIQFILAVLILFYARRVWLLLSDSQNSNGGKQNYSGNSKSIKHLIKGKLFRRNVSFTDDISKGKTNIEVDLGDSFANSIFRSDILSRTSHIPLESKPALKSSIKQSASNKKGNPTKSMTKKKVSFVDHQKSPLSTDESEQTFGRAFTSYLFGINSNTSGEQLGNNFLSIDDEIESSKESLYDNGAVNNQYADDINTIPESNEPYNINQSEASQPATQNQNSNTILTSKVTLVDLENNNQNVKTLSRDSKVKHLAAIFNKLQVH
jgi:hypothetical protein